MNPNDIVINSRGTQLRLKQILAQGGEGVVWKTDQAGWVAKIYNQALSTETQNKLEVMIQSPPWDPNARKNHISYAWPDSLLKNSQGKEIGFLMPAIHGGRELLQICNPRKRKKEKLAVNWQFLHVTAMNVASLIEKLHQAGYILGDIKPQNILVNNQALPSIIDTDSFQVRDSLTGRIYRCPVASENYTPPELLGKDISTIIQNESHDHFRLAVLIYCLLFSTDTPFKGEWMGKGDSASPSELIKQGWWPYASSGLIQAGSSTMPLGIVSKELSDCFLSAFNQGHQQPNARPSAQEWKQALKRAYRQLRECNVKTLHFYSPRWGKCYWCQREQQLGVDIFYGQRKP